MTNTKAFRLSLLALVTLLVGCDHGTKHAAQSSLARGALELVPGVLDLRLTENHDTAFSLLSRFGVHGASTALMVLASLTVLGIAGYWFARRNVASRWEQAGLAMVLAGGLGHLGTVPHSLPFIFSQKSGSSPMLKALKNRSPSK